jgi:hypothetical protein
MGTTYTSKQFMSWSRTAGPQATTAAYVTLSTGSIAKVQKATLVLTESGGQNTMYSIDASMDNATWVNLMTNVDLPANTTGYEVLSNMWRYLRVQIIDKVAGVHGAVSSYLYVLQYVS